MSPPPPAAWKQRRRDDGPQLGTKIVLLVAVCGWAGTFCTDMAVFESFAQVLTPKFLGVHFAQLFFYLASVYAARRLQ